MWRIRMSADNAQGAWRTERPGRRAYQYAEHRLSFGVRGFLVVADEGAVGYRHLLVRPDRNIM